jgi:hypothetical protein
MKIKACLVSVAMVLISIFALLVQIQGILATEPRIMEWEQTFGGSGSDTAHTVIQTSDSGYAIVGVTDSFGAGRRDFWLVKTDALGNMEWNQTYGGSGADSGFSVVETSDGGYALTGITRSYGPGGQNAWLVKTDAGGNVEWNQTYGAANDDKCYSLAETSDGGYALAGSTRSYGAIGEDFWLIKTNSSGDREWHVKYGGPGDDVARSVMETGDGGYVLGGSTESFGAGDDDFWLVKVDSTGGHEWNQTYGGPLSDYAFSVVVTVDGGYALAGRTRSFGTGGADFWLVKVDSTGGHEWNQTYGGAGNDPAHTLIEASLVGTCDGGYVLAGFTLSFGAGGQDGWLVKTDGGGSLDWNQTYGGSYDDVINSVAVTSDKGYILAGLTASSGAGNQDFWLVKLSGPPEYTLEINSLPSSISFTVDSGSQVTTYVGTYEECIEVALEMPEIHSVGSARYYWNQWSDGNTTRSRTITMKGNITITAHYVGPYYELTIDSTPVIGVSFTLDGIPQTSPHSEWLLEGSHTVVMPDTHGGYTWSHWLEDGNVNRVRTITLLDQTTYTAVYKPIVLVGGDTTPIVSVQLTSWTVSMFVLLSVTMVTGIYVRRVSSREQGISKRRGTR